MIVLILDWMFKTVNDDVGNIFQNFNDFYCQKFEKYLYICGV